MVEGHQAVSEPCGPGGSGVGPGGVVAGQPGLSAGIRVVVVGWGRLVWAVAHGSRWS